MKFKSVVLKLFFVVFPGLVGSYPLAGQTIDPTVLSSASGEGKSATVSLSWTLGETAVSAGHTQNRLYTEGFHQPRMILSPSSLKEGQFSIDIAPNPAHSHIRVDIISPIQTEMSIYLNDVRGSRILYSRLAPGVHQTLLNVEGITPGVYFLQIRSISGVVFKSFKVVKL